MLRKIFGPNKEEAGGRRKLHIEELHDFSPHQIKDDITGGACGTIRREDKCTQYFGGET